VVLVSATLLKYMGSGPKWPLVDLNFQQPCANNWWSALLYVQNYVNLTDMVKIKKIEFFFTLKYFQCVIQSWYLNIDFQLYLISPLILYALWKYPRACLSFLVLCILWFVGVSFYVAWMYDLHAILTNFYG
jgi:peptidoglycan/LPS O-acetylase OafA/YrhL